MSNVQHTIFVNTSGDLYSFGKNLNGQLGTGDIIDRIEPTLISVDISSSIIQSAVGESHSVFLLDNGDVHTFGYNLNGRTGLGVVSDNTLIPTMVPSYSPPLQFGEKIVQVSCGNSHTGFVTSEGNLYMCGSNGNSRLGRNTITGDTSQPTFIDLSLILDPGDIVDSISCGSDFSLLLSTNGKIYATGNNESGRTGLNTNSGNTLVFTQITTFTPVLSMDENISSISSGENHSALVTTEGKLYTFGLNDNGRTGLNVDSGETLIPTQVTTFSPALPVEVSIGNVSCGSNHTTVLLSNNDVYSFGVNNFKNVNEENYYTKNEVESFLSELIDISSNQLISGKKTFNDVDVSGVIQLTGSTIITDGISQINQPINISSGLLYYKYNQDAILWATSPISTSEFDQLMRDFVLTSTGHTPDINVFTMEEDFYAVEFKGLFLAEETGTYTFGMNPNDASDFYIDNKLVAYRYDVGGSGTPPTPALGVTTNTMYLEKGYHKLYARYQDNISGDSLTLTYKTPSITTWTIIPSSVLFYEDSALYEIVGTLKTTNNILRGEATLTNSNVDVTLSLGASEFTDPQIFLHNNSGWSKVRGSISGNVLNIIAEDIGCIDTIDYMVVVNLV